MAEIVLIARIQEATNLGERLRDNMKTIDTVNNLGITIITVGVSYGISQNEPIVVVLMPLVLLVVVVHAVQTFTELLMMGGQRRSLEESLRSQMGEYVLFSESVVAPLRVNAIDLQLKQGLYGLTLAGLICFGAWDAHRLLSWFAQLSYGAVLTYGLVTLGVSLRKMTGAYDTAYSAAREALRAEGLHL